MNFVQKQRGEPMDDLISREVAIDGLDAHYVEHRNLNDWQEGWNAALDWVKYTYLDDLPSAQPDLSSYSDKLWRAAYERGKAEARMRGRWIESDTDGFVCSVCRNGYKTQPTIMGKPMFEFCPCCGAKMDGGDTE